MPGLQTMTSLAKAAPESNPIPSTGPEEKRKARRQRGTPIPETLLKDILVAYAPLHRREQELLRSGVRTTDSVKVNDKLRLKYVGLEDEAM